MKAFDKTNDCFKARKTHKSRFKLEHLKSEKDKCILTRSLSSEAV